MADQKKSPDAAEWRVRVRMYRKWLGDCFLLSFRNGAELSHILIDCGALSGTPEGKAKMQAAARHIQAETGGKLDALVISHEHWDHISGFADAADVFKEFRIGEVWAAWTEDPDQTIAKEKKKQSQDQLQAIHLALRRLAESSDPADQVRGAALVGMLDFYPDADVLSGLAAASARTDATMDAALSLGKRTLLNPGDVVERKWLPGVRAYVLAPPKDIGSLHNTDGQPDTDMYGVGAAFAGTASAFAAAAAAGLPDAGAGDPYAPFDAYLQCGEREWSRAGDPPADWARKWPEEWKKEWQDVAANYASDKSRRIDRDWLNMAAELALQLDSYTNNTSLALAFELDGANEVLLFPGDAQIGNWLSWAKVRFKGAGSVSAADLLKRTVFYKVGHHGSHNATLKAGGLEAMQSPSLVAAIPVDEEFAHRPKGGCPKGWDMPAASLLAALQTKTQGRVLRADSDFPQGAKKPSGMADAAWRDFQDAVTVDEMFIEYRIR